MRGYEVAVVGGLIGGVFGLLCVVLGAKLARHDTGEATDRREAREEAITRHATIEAHLGRLDSAMASIESRTAVVEALLQLMMLRKRATDGDDDT